MATAKRKKKNSTNHACSKRAAHAKVSKSTVIKKKGKYTKKLPTTKNSSTESPAILSSSLKKLNKIKSQSPKAEPHTVQHARHINVCVADFLTCLENHGQNAYDDLLRTVKHTYPDGEKKQAAKILVLLGGPKTTEKVQIANKAIVLWQRHTQKKKMTNNFVWYQPTTQNQRMRTFFSCVQSLYGWEMKLETFDFTGGVIPECNKLYRQRYKTFGKVSFVFFE